MTRHSKLAFAFLLALLFGFAGGAQATSFGLGHISGPGHYFLSLFGTATNAFPGPSSHYSGTIQFAQTPLPASLLFMLTALAGFGLLNRRRIGTSADATS